MTRRKSKLMLIAVMFISILILNNDGNRVKVKANNLQLEYGQTLSLDPTDLVHSKNDKVLNSVKVNANDVLLEDDQETPKVGSYNIELTYKQNNKLVTKEVTVTVNDTIKPEFEDFISYIESDMNDSIDLASFYNAQDASPVTITIDDSKVDYKTKGLYTYTVTATDSHNNSVSQDARILIKDHHDISNLDVCNDLIKEPTIVKGQILVNKNFPLPCGYDVGENVEAKANLRNLMKDMQSLNLNLSNIISGYRSFNYQVETFNRWLEKDGLEEALTYSAIPGYSEHQTGLAFDLFTEDGDFITKGKEAQWLVDNAYKYGFIIRYQTGKEDITGYQAEPWHLRYVGIDLATQLHDSNQVLEEYLFNK